jgi:ATP-dependent RNA helicase DeaD
MDTTTEFEIAARVADSFAVKIRRPDKEDTIRIEPLADGSPSEASAGQASSEKPSHAPWRDAGDAGHRAPRRDEAPTEHRGKPHGKKGAKFGGEPGFTKKPGFDKKKKHQDESGHTGRRHSAGTPPAKGAFGKKPKKKHRG